MGESIKVLRETKRHRIEKLLFHEDIGRYLLPDIEDAKEKIKQWPLKNFLFYILQEKGHDFGLIGARKFPKLRKVSVDIGVLKNYRGKKAWLGMRLALKDFEKDHPNYQIWAQIKHYNLRAFEFARHLNFKVIKNLKDKWVLKYEKDKK